LPLDLLPPDRLDCLHLHAGTTFATCSLLLILGTPDMVAKHLCRGPARALPGSDNPPTVLEACGSGCDP